MWMVNKARESWTLLQGCISIILSLVSSNMDGGFNRKIIYKWWMFNCPCWLLEDTLQKTLICNMSICSHGKSRSWSGKLGCWIPKQSWMDRKPHYMVIEHCYVNSPLLPVYHRVKWVVFRGKLLNYRRVYVGPVIFHRLCQSMHSGPPSLTGGPHSRKVGCWMEAPTSLRVNQLPMISPITVRFMIYYQL